MRTKLNWEKIYRHSYPILLGVHLLVTLLFGYALISYEILNKFARVSAHGKLVPNMGSSSILHLFGMISLCFMLVAQFKLFMQARMNQSNGLLIRVIFLVALLFFTAFSVMSIDIATYLSALFVFTSIVLLSLVIKMRELTPLVQTEYVRNSSNLNQSTHTTQVTSSQQSDLTTEESNRIVNVAEYSTISFTDIMGMDDVKQRLLPASMEIINSRDSGKEPRNGILLHGEAGNGKTIFVKALAGELGLPYIEFTFGEAASRFVNNTTENVMQVFKDAKAQAPCILFLDEIDSLIKERYSSDSGGESDKTTNTILTEIVRLRKHDVIFLGATNYLNLLDPAAIRPGRFDFKIEIPAPDEIARLNLLHTAIFENCDNISFDEEALMRLSKRWVGFSVARINAIGREVAELVKQDNLDFIDNEIFIKALRLVQGNKSRLPESTKSLNQMFFNPVLDHHLNAISASLKDAQRIEELGGTVPTGLLFHGPSGTGKSETARALAKDTKLNFISTTGHELLSKNDAIEKLVKEANDARPCIVFIDEADDILADRKTSNYATFTNKLLVAMDGSGGKVPDVLYVAATNNPDRIDSAATRAGRFTEKLLFTYPELEVREKFIQWWMSRTPAKFHSESSPRNIAVAVGDEISIANISGVMQKAVNIMISKTPKNEDGFVLLSHIEEAMHIVQS